MGRLAFLRRLAGLLSGYLPIDTRPQARAKLGIVEISNFFESCKRISSPREKTFLTFLQVAASCDAQRSLARGEGLDAVSVTHELHHDDKAAQHEDGVEDALPDAAEFEQGGERP